MNSFPNNSLNVSLTLILTHSLDVGDAASILLLGFHNQELGSNDENRVQQQVWTTRVIQPLFHASEAHAATLFSSALLFYLTNYGDVASQYCREFLKHLRENDTKVLCSAVQNTLQYAFSFYKSGKQLVLDEANNAAASSEHFMSLCKRLAAVLGVQYTYEVLVGVFEMIKVGIWKRCEA